MSMIYNISPQIGRRNRRIDIMRQTLTTSATGHKESVWAVLATVWAHRKNQAKFKENVDEMQTASFASVDWVIKYRGDLAITELDRVRYKGKLYDIIGIEEINLDSLMELKTIVNKDN